MSNEKDNIMPEIKERKLYEVGGTFIVHVQQGRGEELRLHLESHGIASQVSPLNSAELMRTPSSER